MTTTDWQGATELPITTIVTDECWALANGTPDGIATRTATVLNAKNVHRDWRHLATEAVGVTAAVTAAGALVLAQFKVLPALMWVLAVACGVSAVGLIVLLTLMQREGRRWTYAVTDEPADTV